MKTNRYRSWRILSIVALLAGCASFAMGCQSIGHLRQAQDAFNEAAKIDLEMTYGKSFADDDAAQFSDIVAMRTEVRNLYAAALAHLDMISQKEEASLKENRLYGTVLTLKALCYWKLKEYPKALEVKKEADNLGDKQLIPRDKQVFKLLTALIAVDEALPIVGGMSGKKKDDKKRDFERIKKLLLADTKQKCAALCTIDSVLDEETLDTPMRIYAQQIKLMTLKRYFDAYAMLRTECPAEDDLYWKMARKTLGKLQKTAGDASAPVAKSLVDSWTRKIGCGITVDNGSNP